MCTRLLSLVTVVAMAASTTPAVAGTAVTSGKTRCKAVYCVPSPKKKKNKKHKPAKHKPAKHKPKRHRKKHKH